MRTKVTIYSFQDANTNASAINSRMNQINTRNFQGAFE